jgi:hypothetical protein
MQLAIALTTGETTKFNGMAIWGSIALSRTLRNIGNMVCSDVRVYTVTAICCPAHSRIGSLIPRESDWVYGIIEPNQVGIVAAASAAANTILNLITGA